MTFREKGILQMELDNRSGTQITPWETSTVQKMFNNSVQWGGPEALVFRRADGVVENIHKQSACCRGHSYKRRLSGNSVNREARQESSASLAQAGSVENRESVVYRINRRVEKQRSGRLPLEHKEKNPNDSSCLKDCHGWSSGFPEATEKTHVSYSWQPIVSSVAARE